MQVRKLRKYVPLTREQFRARFYERFYDPAFDDVQPELEKVFERAWDGYIRYRKSPGTQPAGAGFAGPSVALPVEWRDTRRLIQEAEKQQRDPASKSRILVVCASTRSEHSCPGEASKTWRLADHARKAIGWQAAVGTDFLDLSPLARESR